MKKIINILKSKKGFTLIELMIVIGIIGILAGIVMPKINGMQQKAKNTAIASLASSIRTSLEIYYAENSGYPEYGSKISSGSEWSELDNLLDTIKLGEINQYNLSSIEYANNSSNLDLYLIKFISLDRDSTEFFLGEKSFESDNSNNEASDLNIGI
jgi:type IV pilus assembly protein PilA